MDHLTSLLGRCIRARKRSPKCQYQYHDHWPSTSPTAETHGGSFCQRHHQEVTELRPLPHEPKRLTKTSSIRIVETTDSESGTPPPEETPERRFSVSRRRYSDESTAVGGDEKPTSLDQEASPTSTSSTITSTRTVPDTHARRIEDIPEEDEEDHPPPPPSSPSPSTKYNNDDKNDDDNDKKNLPTWRINRRKSLVEILHLLQSASSTTTPKLSNIKLPLAPRSPLRKRGASTTSLPSLSTSLTASTATATPTPEDTDSDEEVKKQRRMGAIVFPAAMRLRGSDGSTGGMGSIGGEGNGRKRRPETVIAGTGGVSSLMTGKDRTLFC